jgi:hypothetical protein
MVKQQWGAAVEQQGFEFSKLVALRLHLRPHAQLTQARQKGAVPICQRIEQATVVGAIA